MMDRSPPDKGSDCNLESKGGAWEPTGRASKSIASRHGQIDGNPDKRALMKKKRCLGCKPLENVRHLKAKLGEVPAIRFTAVPRTWADRADTSIAGDFNGLLF
jgi:hypothetical protein